MAWDYVCIKRLVGPWGSHPALPVEDWQADVAAGDTRQGYWEWVEAHMAHNHEDKVLLESWMADRSARRTTMDFKTYKAARSTLAALREGDDHEQQQ